MSVSGEGGGRVRMKGKCLERLTDGLNARGSGLRREEGALVTLGLKAALAGLYPTQIIVVGAQ